MIRSLLRYVPQRASFCWPVLAAVLTGCNREEITTYRVAKEADPAPPMEAPTAAAQPALTWKLPAGWEEVAPGEMRLASFSVKKDGQHADVSIIPLPGLAGDDLSNVNRWRGQVGQPAVTQEELAKLAEKVEIAGQAGQLFEQAGQNPSANEKNRILAVIQRREGVAWFYKMIGDAALVAQQKPAFIEFLKSVQFQAPGAPAALPPSHPPVGGMAMQPPTAPSGDKPDWKVPAGWQEVAPGQMQLAKFLATGDGGAKAETSVAVIPGDGGGALANVNRWRKQIGLGPIEAADLPKQTSTLDVGASKAMVLDVTSADKTKRMLAASVPRGDGTWFYKLMGDETVVAREKDAFLQFVQSAK